MTGRLAKAKSHLFLGRKQNNIQGFGSVKHSFSTSLADLCVQKLE